MKIKHYIFLSILTVYYLISTIVYINIHLKEVKTECGTVIENFTELCSVKHGTRTEYYLKVKYKDRTEIENVNAKTFYNNHKIGTLICFDIVNKVPFYAEFGFIIGSIAIAMTLLIFLIVYLIT